MIKVGGSSSVLLEGFEEIEKDLTLFEHHVTLVLRGDEVFDGDVNLFDAQ